MTVTPVYAAAVAALLLVLSARVIAFRHRHRVRFGDAGDPELTARVRTQANCAEYAPLGLLLLALTELQGAPEALLHAAGLALLAGQVLRAWGLTREPRSFAGRTAGMALTMGQIALSASVALVLALLGTTG